MRGVQQYKSCVPLYPCMHIAMAKMYGGLPLTGTEKQKNHQHLYPVQQSSKGCVIFLIGIAVLTFSLVLCSCEGSRTDRMIKATERGVDDYNNGDGSWLIMLIIGVIVLGVIWIIGKAIDKNR